MASSGSVKPPLCPKPRTGRANKKEGSSSSSSSSSEALAVPLKIRWPPQGPSRPLPNVKGVKGRSSERKIEIVDIDMLKTDKTYRQTTINKLKMEEMEKNGGKQPVPRPRSRKGADVAPPRSRNIANIGEKLEKRLSAKARPRSRSPPPLLAKPQKTTTSASMDNHYVKNDDVYAVPSKIKKGPPTKPVQSTPVSPLVSPQSSPTDIQKPVEVLLDLEPLDFMMDPQAFGLPNGQRTSDFQIRRSDLVLSKTDLERLGSGKRGAEFSYDKDSNTFNMYADFQRKTQNKLCLKFKIEASAAVDVEESFERNGEKEMKLSNVTNGSMEVDRRSGSFEKQREKMVENLKKLESSKKVYVFKIKGAAGDQVEQKLEAEAGAEAWQALEGWMFVSLSEEDLPQMDCIESFLAGIKGTLSGN